MNATLAARLATVALALVAGCAVLDPSPEATITKDSSTVPALTGEQLYISNCAGCHGLTGAPSDTAIVKDIRDWPGDYAKFDTVMSDNGPGAMPNFPELDQAARRKIFDHIKTLRK